MSWVRPPPPVSEHNNGRMLRPATPYKLPFTFKPSCGWFFHLVAKGKFGGKGLSQYPGYAHTQGGFILGQYNGSWQGNCWRNTRAKGMGTIMPPYTSLKERGLHSCAWGPNVMGQSADRAGPGGRCVKQAVLKTSVWGCADFQNSAGNLYLAVSTITSLHNAPSHVKHSSFLQWLDKYLVATASCKAQYLGQEMRATPSSWVAPGNTIIIPVLCPCLQHPSEGSLFCHSTPPQAPPLLKTCTIAPTHDAF